MAGERVILPGPALALDNDNISLIDDKIQIGEYG
jgi:hypothetical protein